MAERFRCLSSKAFYWRCVVKGSQHTSKDEPLCHLTLQEGSFSPFPFVVDSLSTVLLLVEWNLLIVRRYSICSCLLFLLLFALERVWCYGSVFDSLHCSKVAACGNPVYLSWLVGQGKYITSILFYIYIYMFSFVVSFKNGFYILRGLRNNISPACCCHIVCIWSSFA